MVEETPSWLNLDFMQDILRRSEADNSIEVINVFTKAATAKGDNYTSEMLRVFVELSRELASEKVNEKKSVIIKLAPTNDGVLKDMVTESKIFDTEISMMTDTLEKMNDLLGQRHRLNGRILHHQKDPFHLMIEDLAPLGFCMADRQGGLDLDHCILAIRGLARFHASSVALCEKEPHQKKLYSKGIFCHEYPKEISVFFTAGVGALADEVETWPELGKRYADKLRALKDHIYNKGGIVSKPDPNGFNVINHGDSWVNNMLFKYNDQRKPIEHIFVDFQMCFYTSPAIDLLYFLSTSPQMDVYDNHMETLINEYLTTLTTTMKQLNCKTKAPTMNELQEDLKKRALYGMIASFTILPVVVTDKSDVVDLDEMMSKDGTYNNPAYKGKIYRKIITRRIPVYEKMGLLEL